MTVLRIINIVKDFFLKKARSYTYNLIDPHVLYYKFTKSVSRKDDIMLPPKADITLGELDVMRLIKINFVDNFIKVINKLIKLGYMTTKPLSGRTMFRYAV